MFVVQTPDEALFPVKLSNLLLTKKPQQIDAALSVHDGLLTVCVCVFECAKKG